MSSVTSPDQVALAERRLEEGQHHQRLRRLRDKERQRRHATLAIGAVVGILLMASLLAALDFYLELGTTTRLLGWGVIGLSITWLVAASWRWVTFDQSDAVHEAEKRWPEMGQRLRTSHDYLSNRDAVAPADRE